MHEGAKSFSGNVLETLDHDLHRSRRTPLAKFFSKRSVQAIEHLVIEKADGILNRFKNDKGKIINLNDAMAAMTTDIISEYAFGQSTGAMEKEEYGKSWLNVLHEGIKVHYDNDS